MQSPRLTRPRSNAEPLQELLDRPAEKWTHPKTGEKLYRRSLGICRRGRLAIRRDADSFVSLFWVDDNPHLRGAFNPALWATIGQDRKPDHLGEGIYRLVRLQPGDYRLEQAADGSVELFKLTHLDRAPRRSAAVVSATQSQPRMRTSLGVAYHGRLLLLNPTQHTVELHWISGGYTRGSFSRPLLRLLTQYGRTRSKVDGSGRCFDP
jgi:hypothetical protein